MQGSASVVRTMVKRRRLAVTGGKCSTFRRGVTAARRWAGEPRLLGLRRQGCKRSRAADGRLLNEREHTGRDIAIIRAAAQEDFARAGQFANTGVVESAPERLVRNVSGAVGEMLLVNARNLFLVIRRGEIAIAVQEVTGVFGVRVPTAAPGKPYVELSLNARLPSENVLARGVAPGQVTRREVW